MVATGEIFCLTAALLWAVAVIMFRAPIALHGARTVNLFKSLMATVLLGVTVPMIGSWSQFEVATPRDLWLIAISGLIGITIGDTALFAAVSRIGVHRTLLLQTTAPIFTAVFATTLGQQLTRQQILGSVIVLAGITLVVSGQNGEEGRPNSSRNLLTAGFLLAILAAFGQGTGVVLAKLGLGSVPVLPATFLRLAAGASGLLVLAFFHRGLTPLFDAMRNRSSIKHLVPASILGTFLAMLLLMMGVALAPAAVAAVLLATVPIFSLVIEAWIDRKMPAISAIGGTLIAVAGVAVLTTA